MEKGVKIESVKIERDGTVTIIDSKKVLHRFSYSEEDGVTNLMKIPDIGYYNSLDQIGVSSRALTTPWEIKLFD